jgi:hypothetical protein
LQIKTVPVDGPRHFDYLQDVGKREIEIEEGLIILPGFTSGAGNGNLTLNDCF